MNRVDICCMRNTRDENDWLFSETWWICLVIVSYDWLIACMQCNIWDDEKIHSMSATFTIRCERVSFWYLDSARTKSYVLISNQMGWTELIFAAWEKHEMKMIDCSLDFVPFSLNDILQIIHTGLTRGVHKRMNSKRLVVTTSLLIVEKMKRKMILTTFK